MARHTDDEPETGNDSFLDVVINIVGILIILVMVVGERAKSAYLKEESPEVHEELLAAQSEAVRLENDVHELADRMARVQAELQAKMLERGQLHTLVTAIEKDLEARRQKLDAEAQARYAIDRDLALARDELARLEGQQAMTEKAADTKTIQIESYPTPIGKTVDGDEMHVQLKHGRLAVLPYDLLMDRLRGELRSAANRMGDQSELVETLGPIEGFRMRYVLQRQPVAYGAVFQLAYVAFLPTSSQLGEPVEEALQPGSRFRDALSRHSPARYTITIWTYPDSFAGFAHLKKVLYEMGYAVAARPLPDGTPIGASPNGSKSSAQ
jgi:hypothetical protein